MRERERVAIYSLVAVGIHRTNLKTFISFLINSLFNISSDFNTTFFLKQLCYYLAANAIERIITKAGVLNGCN